MRSTEVRNPLKPWLKKKTVMKGIKRIEHTITKFLLERQSTLKTIGKGHALNERRSTVDGLLNVAMLNWWMKFQVWNSTRHLNAVSGFQTVSS